MATLTERSTAQNVAEGCRATSLSNEPGPRHFSAVLTKSALLDKFFRTSFYMRVVSEYYYESRRDTERTFSLRSASGARK